MPAPSFYAPLLRTRDLGFCQSHLTLGLGAGLPQRQPVEPPHALHWPNNSMERTADCGSRNSNVSGRRSLISVVRKLACGIRHSAVARGGVVLPALAAAYDGIAFDPGSEVYLPCVALLVSAVRAYRVVSVLGVYCGIRHQRALSNSSSRSCALMRTRFPAPGQSIIRCSQARSVERPT